MEWPARSGEWRSMMDCWAHKQYAELERTIFALSFPWWQESRERGIGS